MRRAVPLLFIAVLLSACGGAARHPVSGGPRLIRLVPPKPDSLRFSTTSNRQAAFADVRKLVRVIVVPKTARPVRQVPANAPAWFRDRTRMFKQRGTATTRRIWIVREPLKQVVRFVRANARPRPRPEAGYRTGGGRIGTRPSTSYEFPPIPGRSWSRYLNVDMAPLPDGSTVVFAQAGDTWTITPPRSAAISKGVKQIDIVSRLGKGRPNVLVHVRQRYEVASIVAETNGVGAIPGHIACLLFGYSGPAVTLRFRGADGHLIARAEVSGIVSGPCNPLELTVGSRTTRLIGADLLLRIERMLNINLAPPLPAYVSGCLSHDHGWKARPSGRNLTATKGGRRWQITFHLTGKVTTDKPAPPALARCMRVSRVAYG